MSKMVVGVSLKAYLGLRETEQWLDDVRAHLAGSVVDIFVLPSYPAIPMAVRTLSGTGIGVGSQDVSWQLAGPWTGDVTARWPDGLFIGRAALSIDRLVRIVAEVASGGALAIGVGISQ